MVLVTENVEIAAQALREGKLVAFPTETVYGLGADAGNDAAVAAIYAAKGRPQFNPLIVHVASLQAAQPLAHFSEAARTLAEAFWPGPLTLVLERARKAPISHLTTAGLTTVALRVPDHPLALSFLERCARPVAAPSANVSGRLSPTEAEHVAESPLAAHLAIILDGGECRVGVESTIIGFDEEGAPLLLRPGGIPRKALEAVLGREVKRAQTPSENRPQAPGQLSSHYAPRARLRLDAPHPEPGEMFLAFGPDAPKGVPGLNLSPSGDLKEAAANLFAYLHILDETGVESIAVAPIPDEGLGEAINDRLRRAAAPRAYHDVTEKTATRPPKQED